MERENRFKGVYIHPTAEVSDEAIIARGTAIWNQAQVREHAQIGMNCNLGKDTYIDIGVKIGNNVKIQNGVSVYRGVEIEDDVLLGPYMTFSNDLFPRAWIIDFEVADTRVKTGASIGANATIICGTTIGEFSMIGAGSVVCKNVPPYALVLGNPAKVKGFVGRSGQKLNELIEETETHVLLRCSKNGEEQKIDKTLYYKSFENK